MFEKVLNRNAKHTELKKNTFQNGPKSFLSRTKLRELVGNAKQSIFIAPAFSKVRYRGSTFRPFVRSFVRPSVHNLRRV